MKEGWKYKKLGDTLFFDKRFQGLRECKQEKIVSFSHVSAEELKSLVDDNGDVRLLSTGNYAGYTTKEKAGKSLNDGEVITIPTGGTANIKYYKGLFVDSGNIIGIASSASIVLRFIYYAMIAKNDIINSYYRGVGIKHPYMPDIYKIPIPVPSTFEQKHIVEELDLLGSIIEKKKAQLNELDNMAQSLFYEMFGDPITNEKGWEVKNLCDLCNIGTGATPSRTKEDIYYGGDINWVKTTEVHNCNITETEETITQLALEQTNCKIYPPSTLLMAMYGQGKTRGQIAKLKIHAATNQACAAIMLNESMCNTDFMYELLHLKYDSIRNMAQGGNQANLNLRLVGTISIILPPLDLQQQFSSKIEAIEHQKELIKQSIKEVETLFNSRMYYYFN